MRLIKFVLLVNRLSLLVLPIGSRQISNTQARQFFIINEYIRYMEKTIKYFLMNEKDSEVIYIE